MSDLAPTSTLSGWRRASFTAAGFTHDVYEKGDGPGVVLLPEIPGITPQVIGLGEHLVREGFFVAMPSLFGAPGRRASPGYAGRVTARLCVSAEFQAFAMNASRPITAYLRSLARDLAARRPGHGVGIIGLCFTGGFALAAAVDDAVIAPVVSQPAVPLPLGRLRRRDPGVSDDELDAIAERRDRSGLCVLGLRFSEDRGCARERFDTLRQRLGDAFEVIELDSSPHNTHGFSRHAHSVLTNEVRERPGHAAFDARARVVSFLRQRLVLRAGNEEIRP